MLLDNTNIDDRHKGEPKPTIISLVKYPTNKLPIANKASGEPVAALGSWVYAIHLAGARLLLINVKNNKRYE
jgi:hypothetical protein